MFTLTGINTHIENLYKVSAPFLGDLQPTTLQELRPAYLEFLASVHPGFPISAKNSLLVTDERRGRELASAFSASKIDDLDQERMVGEGYSQDLLNSNLELADASLAKLSRLHPQLSELFHVVVHSLLLRGSDRNREGSRAHGGTTNRCIGLIWLNLDPSCSVHNVLEMLVHEFIHTVVFIDELNYGHFDYETLTKREYWATSSILKRERPMDKVVHSILVSLEILMARQSYLPITDERDLFHPESAKLKSSALVSVDSVLSHPLRDEVCEPRAIELVEMAKLELLNL